MIISKNSETVLFLPFFLRYDFNFYICFSQYLIMSEEIHTATKWFDLVSTILPNERKNFPAKHKNTIRYYISNQLMKDFPDRIYKTWVNNTTESLTVYRVA